MDRSAAERIRSSFAAISPNAGAMVGDFYRRLFEACPESRALFPGDMQRLEGHLLATLATVAKNIDRMDVLEEPLMQLGADHIRFGARPEQYPIVRDCLIAALRQAGGSEWSPQLDQDWFIALSTVCETMLRGVFRATNQIAQGSGARGAGIRPSR